MGFPALVFVAFGVQLLLGYVLCAGLGWIVRIPRLRRGPRGRRWRVTWARALRALGRAVPCALAGLGLGLVLGLWPFLRGAAAPGRTLWSLPGPIVLLGAPPTSSCYLLLQAGRWERHGRLMASRLLARLGGLGMAVGTLVLLTGVFGFGAFRGGSWEEVPAHGVSTVALLGAATFGLICSSFLGLAAGLAGKPRPSALIVSLIHAGSFIGLLGVEHLLSS